MTLDSWGGRDVVTWGPGRKTGVFELDVEVTREAGGVTRGGGGDKGSGFPRDGEGGERIPREAPGGEPRS